MALTLNSETTRINTLEEYIAHVDRNVDVRDLASVCASADELKALANNRTFLTEHLNRELMDWRNCQNFNSYTAQTLILGTGKDYIVRANIWTPPAQDTIDREDQRRLFSYEIPHDHNFSFLTAGYLGPGYETTIYEYDRSRVKGELGEKVDLDFLETTTLPAGKLMLYRASRDVHVQAHPAEFSISLNLLLAPPETNRLDQFLFDLRSSEITHYVKNPATSRIMTCRIARYLGDSRTSELLDRLTRVSDSPRVRLAAAQSLTTLEPADSAGIWMRAADDSSPLVRGYARQQLSARHAASR